MATEPKHFTHADMTDAEFRAALAQVSDWVAAFRARAEKLPVLAQTRPGQIEAALPAAPPAAGEPIENCLADLDRIILPGVTHWNHPGFLAYFATSASGPGILGELVSAALNLNGMLWKTSPALTELELVVMRWYAISLGLPADWFGMITDKAALVLGLGRQGIRRIAADENFRMRVDALEDAIRRDRAAGKHPFAVVATVGTTSATAVDPVAAIADVCRRHNLWLHVDAAYAGSAAIAPELRWALDGCDRADSLVVNPHKWLFVPIDCSALYTRRPEMLRAAFSLVPEYLRTDAGDVVDLMDYSFQLGRRFRALKLWFVFRAFGTEGIAARIREHVRLAQEFAGWVDAHPQLERMAPAPFSVVCVRVHPKGMDDAAELERLNATVLEKVNASGEVFLSHTKLKGRYCLRVAVGNLATAKQHIRRAFDLVCSAAGVK